MTQGVVVNGDGGGDAGEWVVLWLGANDDG